MSCPNNEATKLNTRQEDECKGTCDFNFSYNSNSTCKLINKGDYLEIKTDGKNKITYNSQPISLNGARLYAPSLHTFDGKHADAELILKHNGGSNNYLVCLPIKVKVGTGDSINFFKQIAPHIPLEKNSPSNVNVKNWSLNDVMPAPKTPFYHYIGQSPYPPCHMKATMIVFDNDHASAINEKDLNLIKTTIKPAANSSNEEGFVGGRSLKEGFVAYNSNGANNKESDDNTDQAMECTEYYDTDPTSSSSSSNEGTSKTQHIDWSKITKSTTFIVIIVIFFILAGGVFFYYVLRPSVGKWLDGVMPVPETDLEVKVGPAGQETS